jgi:hypothetical protein
MALATFILSIHLLWLAAVIFGAFFTRHRPAWSAAHVLALIWGIFAEIGPWPCPLTVAEQYFRIRANQASYPGGFLLHYLDAIVYPNLPGWVVASAGVTVCLLNLGVYARRFIKSRPPL